MKGIETNIRKKLPKINHTDERKMKKTNKQTKQIDRKKSKNKMNESKIK